MKLKLPELSEGEIYVGCIGDALGNLHHVILLPGDNAAATWEAQMEWAKSIGGDLPNRIEQAMLWANHRDQFEKCWYWSNEMHHSESDKAWYQHFSLGTQILFHRFDKLRARAVRRLTGADLGDIFERAVRQGMDVSHQVACVAQEFSIAAYEMARPSVLYRPVLLLDGDQWCALYGSNLQEGVAGFGKSPKEAMEDFDKSWNEVLK